MKLNREFMASVKASHKCKNIFSSDRKYLGADVLRVNINLLQIGYKDRFPMLVYNSVWHFVRIDMQCLRHHFRTIKFCKLVHTENGPRFFYYFVLFTGWDSKGQSSFLERFRKQGNWVESIPIYRMFHEKHSLNIGSEPQYLFKW